MPARGLLSLETPAWISFFPLNAPDHSSYILLQHYVMSMLTHWGPLLRHTVHVITVVGTILSAAMSTAVSQCKVTAILHKSRSLGFASLEIVQDLAAPKQCTVLGRLPCTMLDDVILISLPLPGPRRGIPFIPYFAGTRMSMLACLVHPGYEN